MGDPHGQYFFFERGGEQAAGLRYCDRIKIFPAQTTLGTQTDLGTQPCCNIPSGQ